MVPCHRGPCAFRCSLLVLLSLLYHIIDYMRLFRLFVLSYFPLFNRRRIVSNSRGLLGHEHGTPFGDDGARDVQMQCKNGTSLHHADQKIPDSPNRDPDSGPVTGRSGNGPFPDSRFPADRESGIGKSPPKPGKTGDPIRFPIPE
jgi:hypothetical protein